MEGEEGYACLPRASNARPRRACLIYTVTHYNTKHCTTLATLQHYNTRHYTGSRAMVTLLSRAGSRPPRPRRTKLPLLWPRQPRCQLPGARQQPQQRQPQLQPHRRPPRPLRPPILWPRQQPRRQLPRARRQQPERLARALRICGRIGLATEENSLAEQLSSRSNT